MSQVTTGIRGILSMPSIYNYFQSLIGARQGRVLFAERDLRIKSGDRVLDIGCGTAEMLSIFPADITYVGYDISEDYINAAKKKFPARNAKFHARELSTNEALKHEKFDVIFASGLLHHLEDSEVLNLFSMVREMLANDARFISVDPCYLKDQGFISKTLVSMDRGQNIRTVEELSSLANKTFDQVQAKHYSDYLRIPYDHVLLECGQ